jgi:hypothetical protein
VDKRWIHEEPTTLHDYLLFAQEVSHRDTKGTALNISLDVSGGGCSQHEYPFLSRREGELANERPLLDIRDIRDTSPLTNRSSDSAHRA